ncbi:SHOCT domain-containing protein [Natrinema salaciae]|uniref:Short C-terminal domain-containing protein n=1 Tax=Natrinema salaciae TaxID=1186196 RepID=A0A1H9AUH0_9EURY|nr:SHOCT domain-containing protein [Natrinema salaciae]SEP80390.1 Short C-terminal domain-containing protein [Natrinema salaciae]
MDAIEGTDRRGDADDPWSRVRENATGIASLLVTAIWLGAMFTGQSWWLAALLVGYIAVVPLVAILFGDEADRREWADDYLPAAEAESDGETTSGEPEADARDALETLRERYAAGELTDDQFERKLERLLDTETLEDAQAWARDRTRSGERNGDREPEFDR